MVVPDALLIKMAPHARLWIKSAKVWIRLQFRSFQPLKARPGNVKYWILAVFFTIFWSLPNYPLKETVIQFSICHGIYTGLRWRWKRGESWPAKSPNWKLPPKNANKDQNRKLRIHFLCRSACSGTACRLKINRKRAHMHEIRSLGWIASNTKRARN